MITLANSHLRLTLLITDGMVSPTRLESADGTVWADEPATILLDLRSAEGAVLRARSLRYLTHTVTADSLVVETEAHFALGNNLQPALRVQLHYTMSPDAPVLSEQIELLVGPSQTQPLRLHRAAFIWRLRKRPGLSWTPIPFGESHGSSAPVLLTDAATSCIVQRDGAVLYDSASQCGLLVAKTPSDRDPEYVVVEVSAQHIGFSGFRPEQAFNDCPRWLESGRYLSSPTQFECVHGPQERVFTAHRAFMESRGIGLPENYAPPFNYCIYYECGNHWERAQAEALLPVAASLGCTLFYTDQGWETGFGSGLWDEGRLGSCADFVATAARAGLDVGVLVSLHASPTGAAAWPPEVFRLTAHGTVEDGDRWHPHGLCAGSPLWRREKTKRLAKVAAAGVKFFSFDFNDAKDYAGFGFRRYPCHAHGHDHGQKQTEWEHVAAVAEQQREFRQACPDALVEAHDWALAGDASLPGYLFPGSAQERWGFEYMWNPFADLAAGRLQNLYYFNLAYNRPLYLHLDLKNDHPETLVAFWYLASTIRHLGIGNFTAISEDHQRRVKAAIAVYLDHREFFSRGVFYGAGPCVHVHAIPGRGALLLFFNDHGSPGDITATFDRDDLGLPTTVAVLWETLWGDSPALTADSGRFGWKTPLSAWGVCIVRIRPA